MKLIVECTEQTYSKCKKISGLSETALVIANGKPYDDSGDCISREALKEHKVYSEERHEYVVPVYNIDNAQAVEDRPQGEWINPSENPELSNREFFYDCSICGNTQMDETNFCPNCGASMKGGAG